MNRRNFLGLMVGGVAAAAAVRTFPFRVFSFPNEPKLWIGTDYGFSGCSSMSLTVWSKESLGSWEENLGSWLVDDTFYRSVRGREFRVTSLVSDVPHDNALSPTPLRHFLADSSGRFRSGE